MIKNLARSLVQAYRSRTRARAGIVVRPDDTFLVSYPRSGNTWLRFLVANLAMPKDGGDGEVSFENIGRRVPDIYRTTHAELQKMPGPRYLKSHESFAPLYPKVIYVVRDPRDVAVAAYHYCIKTERIPEGAPLGAFVDGFVGGNFFRAFGTWAQNVGSWHGAMVDSDRFSLLRYEDLLAEPASNVAKLCRSLGIERSEEQIAWAIDASSSDRMRKMEKESAWSPEGRQRPGCGGDHAGAGGRPIPFVRAAGAGAGKKELPDEARGLIESAWARQMREFGYL